NYLFSTMPGYVDNASALDAYIHIKLTKKAHKASMASSAVEFTTKSLQTPSVLESVSGDSVKSSKRVSMFATNSEQSFFLSSMHL
ncbi:hypothetical protein HDU98_001266, partial [Podochytrium sp. JEL0797]